MTSNAEDLLKKLSRHVPGILFQFRMFPGGRFCFPYASEGIKDIIGLTPEEVREDARPAFKRVHPDDMAYFEKSIRESATSLEDWKYEYRVINPEKGIRWIQGAARPERIEDGSIVWHGYVNDFTDRKEIEEELLTKNRLLSTSQKINGMIVHSRTNEDIYSKVCEIVTSHRQFKLAWIGIFDPETQQLVPVAKSGSEDEYVDEIPRITIKDVAEGKGPSGTAFREKRTVVNNDLLHNPNFAPWRQMALRRGFQSSIALPLIVKNEAIGTFNIYSSDADYFTTDEVAILEDITRNMSFAIGVLEDRKLLIQSELYFRTIFDRSPMGILVADAIKGEVYQINDRFLELLGRKRETLGRMTWMEITHPEDLEQDIKSRELMAVKKIPGFKSTKRYLKTDQTYFWADALVVPFGPSEDGRPKDLVMVQDISDRKSFEDLLHKAIAIKDEFFAIASHELKTPTTSLKLQLQMLKRGMGQEKDLDKFTVKIVQGIDRCLGQLDRLVELVNNLMDVVNFRRGNLSINLARLDLSSVLQEAIQKFDVLFREKGCDVSVDIRPEILGNFDRTRIEQVFFNLMDNATKYAQGSQVTIVLSKKDNQALFMISDQGPGIASSKLEKIFDRFERLGADRNFGGLGLGLYIAKNIVDAHEGKISVESTVGKGTTFRIVLPLQ